MSDVAPFAEGHSAELAPADPLQTPGLFKPDLSDVDWVAYEIRQEVLDEQAGSTTGLETGKVLADLHQANPDLGVMVNNLDHRIIDGQVPRYLNASFSILALSSIQTDMVGLDLQKAVTTETDFGGRDFKGGDFTDAVMVRANLAGADLRGVSFVNVVMNGANLTGALLDGADFTGAYLQDVEGMSVEQLKHATLTGARMMLPPSDGSTLDQQLISRFGAITSVDDIRKQLSAMPVSIDQVPPKLNSNKIYRGLIVQGGVWKGKGFTGSDFTGATIDNLLADQTTFDGATLSGARISNSSFKEAYMFGAWAPGTIFEDVNLTGANLTGMNLCGAIFRAVDLRRAVGLDPRGSNLNGIHIDDSTRLPQGYGFDGRKLQATAKVLREIEG